MTEAGRSLGTIADVIANPANDLWVARDDEGTETLVPAIREVIVEVDVEAKRVAGARRAGPHRPRRTTPDGPR